MHVALGDHRLGRGGASQSVDLKKREKPAAAVENNVITAAQT